MAQTQNVGAFFFGEHHLTPEEEAAYKLAREEADAYHKRRLEASKKRKSLMTNRIV